VLRASNAKTKISDVASLIRAARTFYNQERDMRFMMIMIPEVYGKPIAPDFMPDMEAVKKMGEYNEALQQAGVLLALDGLMPPSAGARVSFAGGKAKVTDGPFPGSKEAVGGFWMIRVKSRDEAIEQAKRCPAGVNDVIEIRQVHEPEDFGLEVARQERKLAGRIASQS